MSPPRVATWGPNRLDVFVLGTDRALYHKWWDGSNWGPSVTGYEYMGGICMSPPEVVAWGPDRLDVFVLGTDSAVYHKWWDGATGDRPSPATSPWAASALRPPQVVAWGPNRLDVFVIGTDSALYHKWWDGSAWGLGHWEYLGGVCTERADRGLVGPEPARRVRDRHRLARCTTSGGTAPPGVLRSPATSTWAASAPASRAWSRGARTGSTFSSPAPTARCTTSGGTARTGDRRSPATKPLGGVITDFKVTSPIDAGDDPSGQAVGV